MNIELDVHTHTIVSGHAYSTIQEMANAAAEKNLKLLGITDHAPALPGACHEIYFRNLHVIPRVINGVKLLIGAELNILNTNGDIDLSEEMLDKLDVRVAGIHSLCYTPGTIEENTAGLLKVINHPKIEIISHPGDGTALLDFEPIVLAAKTTRTLLEINNSSLNPIRHKLVARENNLTLLKLCKKYEVPIILGSDAHISFDVANYTFVYELLNEVEFPESLIVNTSVPMLASFISSIQDS